MEINYILWNPRHKLEKIVMESTSIFKFPIPDTMNLYGGFNEIMSAIEKCEGLESSQQQIKGFRNAVNVCDFQDIWYMGHNFTWCNWRSIGERVFLRLDRVFATVKWVNHYHNSKGFNFWSLCSLVDRPTSCLNLEKKWFHFEVAWTKYEKCREVIQEIWKNHSELQSSNGLVEGLNEY